MCVHASRNIYNVLPDTLPHGTFWSVFSHAVLLDHLVTLLVEFD